MAKKTQGPSDDIRVAITFPSMNGEGPVKASGPISLNTIDQYKPNPVTVAKGLDKLRRLGFTVTSQGRMSASVRGKRELFEKTFGTSLSEVKMDQTLGRCQFDSFYYPGQDADWKVDSALENLIDDAYIQWPHSYMNHRFKSDFGSPLPPRVDYHHLRVPGDISMLLNASRAHRQGITGKGVKVAMIDSGFAMQHPYFQENGYTTTTVLAPGATDVNRDGNGHGTAESANLLAMAPDVQFIGVKLDNENNPSQGASILEGFQTALSHNPQIISVSLGYSLTDQFGGHLDFLPNSLRALEAEIEQAVADGVVVVFAAGNGHVAFPGMMPDVLSAGGVYVDEQGKMIASDYASAFDSAIYPGRRVPDVCGLVGMKPTASYIMLPLEPGCDIDRSNDGTGRQDGWSVISGTSAAAPQLAGACALLKQKNPGLSPSEVKSALMITAADVAEGHANPSSNFGVGLQANSGIDGATGFGLIDANFALQMV